MKAGNCPWKEIKEHIRYNAVGLQMQQYIDRICNEGKGNF